MLREAFQKSSHEENTSNTTLPSQFINKGFCIIFISVHGSTVSTMTRIYTGKSGIQILARAREIHILENIQTSSSAHTVSNSMKNRAFSLTVKWSGQTV
jgi:hypothetical protein